MSAPLAMVAVFGAMLQVAHDGSWVADGIRWTTEWRADRIEPRIDLAAPLPADAEVIGDEVRPIRDAQGRIQAFELVRPNTMGRVELRFAQPLDADALVVPVFDTPAVQRVTVDGIAFRPDDGLGFEKHTRYWAPAALAGKARSHWERDWKQSGGDRAHSWDQAVYFRAEPELASGLPGTIRIEGQISPVVQGMLALALVALLAFAGLLYRGLERQARAERNASYIRHQFGDPSEQDG